MGLLSKLFGESTNDIPAICNVNLERYLGTWYEIARFPHSFEKGLDNVTASYSLRSDGKIRVVNSGLKNRDKKSAGRLPGYPIKLVPGYFT